MKIEERKLSELVPYENNPRKNDQAVDTVANCIKEFGFKVPIVVDKNDVIISGHTRYKAAQKLGLDVVPTIKADDLSEEQVKAFRLADNKSAEIAEWDMDLLEKELKKITEINMDDFGFDMTMFEEVNSVEEDEFTEDAWEEPVTQSGMLWILGEHRLLCGDSSDSADMSKLFEGGGES